MVKRKRVDAGMTRYLPYVRTAYNVYKAGKQVYNALYPKPKIPVGRGLYQRSISRRRKYMKKSYARRKLLKLGVSYNSVPHDFTENYSLRSTGAAGQLKMTTIGGTFANPTPDSRIMKTTTATYYGKSDPDSMICVKNQVYEMMISNSSNGPCYLTVYFLKMKKDWTVEMGANFDIDIVQEGFGNVNLPVSSVQILGTTIYQNKKLMEWCTVVKTVKTVLQAGGVRKIYYVDRNIKRFNLQFLTEYTAPPTQTGIFITKGTVFPFLVWHGSPVHDDTTPSNVSTARADLDICIAYKWQSHNIETGPYNVSDSQPFPTVTTPVRFIDNEKTEVAVQTGA